MIRGFLTEHTNPPVFLSSAVVVLGFVGWGALSPATLGAAASATNDFITTNFEWLYILGASFFLVFAVFIMLGRYGSVRLGPSDSQPEYNNLAWFAMLFTAGMGIGLVFYAVAEPVAHFLSPPTGRGSGPGAAEQAMHYTIFHWGLHPWAIYIVLGLALGYFAFRRELPLRPASALYPLLGERAFGWIGNLIDLLAVFGTLFGLATSLGIGGQQVSAGLAAVFGLNDTPTLAILLILGITGIAVVSVMLGLDKGIRNLSLVNLWFAFALMLFVFFFGPTRDLLNTFAANLGTYVQNLPKTSFSTFPGNAGAQDWQKTWTLFYWGWWISWSPFVGMFIARISYGRTIRGFIGGTLTAPVGASMVWLTIFGDSALRLLQREPGNPLAQASSEKALFVLLDQLPVADILITMASLLAILIVVLFFATSSDSGSLVIDILTNGGDPNPKWQARLFWATLEGVIAAVLVAAGAYGGANALDALQAASLAAGLPFCIVLLVICLGLYRGLRGERITTSVVRKPSPLIEMRKTAVERAQARKRGGATEKQQAEANQDGEAEQREFEAAAPDDAPAGVRAGGAENPGSAPPGR